MYYFYECEICSCVHPCQFVGDCRDDNNRFDIQTVESQFGGWENVTVVPMFEADNWPAKDEL
jgi:hypothetical protein